MKQLTVHCKHSPSSLLKTVGGEGREGKAHEEYEWVNFADSSNYGAWKSAYKYISHDGNSWAGLLLYDK